MASYVAVLVLESMIDALSAESPLVDHQIRLVEAVNADSAYERALFLGRSEEHTYTNADGKRVHWAFRGLHDLCELDSAVGDGVEIYSFRRDASDSLPVVAKDRLSVFWLER